MGGADIARPYVADAASTHPSLLDETHAMDARFGITNIPMAMWIDETGTIVRPPEPATPPPVGATAEGIVAMIGDGAMRERYLERLRDWVANGAASRYALSPDEVIARSQ